MVVLLLFILVCRLSCSWFRLVYFVDIVVLRIRCYFRYQIQSIGWYRIQSIGCCRFLHLCFNSWSWLYRYCGSRPFIVAQFIAKTCTRHYSYVIRIRHLLSIVHIERHSFSKMLKNTKATCSTGYPHLETK